MIQFHTAILFKDSDRSVIPDDTASINAQAADLEAKMTPEQIEEGKRLAKEAEVRLTKLPRFSGGQDISTISKLPLVHEEC